MGRLSGRVVAITGASSGIGAAIARRAAVEGAAVAVCARRSDRLDALVSELELGGGHALAVPGDVTDQEDMRAFVDRTLAGFGRLDIMVCNAGIGYHGPFETTPKVAMERLVDVNLMGTFYAAQAALVAMRDRGQGHIIVVSSIVGRRGVGGSAVYSATKAAQIAFVESLRSDCVGTHIQASAVLPISTATEFRDAIARDFGHAVKGVGPRQSADVVAQAVIRCMLSPRAEVYPYRVAWLLSVLNVLAPGLTDRIVRRFRREQTSVSP